MNTRIAQLQPIEVWSQFAALNAVPRASKKEEEIIAFMQNFAKQHQLECFTDEVGNVIIKKHASEGYEGKPTVCLQGHLDMVHQKNNDTIFDFATQGIDMYIDGDWVRAQGTTLGADNGLGVAAIMAVLVSKEINHPPIEALFTIDEETGMTGAKGLKGGLLKATVMLNLDTEEDDELTIGCAGGVDVTGENNYPTIATPASHTAFQITIKGLSGGHSGGDIHVGKGNANKIMNRLLHQFISKYAIGIAQINGGSLRNAIPRESVATITVEAAEAHQLNEDIKTFQTIIFSEYRYTDPLVTVSISPIELPTQIADANFARQFIATCYAIPNGIYRMDSNIVGLVQSSNNLSKIVFQDGKYSIQNLTRSSNESEKWEVAETIKVALENLGAKVSFGGDYPGWQPKPDADIVKLMIATYKKLNNNEMPKVNAVHAGLECGILGGNYPAMDMISFGPTIHGAHSPDERACISSTQKFWKYLVKVLENM
jgi:dipeptidase D